MNLYTLKIAKNGHTHFREGFFFRKTKAKNPQRTPSLDDQLLVGVRLDQKVVIVSNIHCILNGFLYSERYNPTLKESLVGISGIFHCAARISVPESIQKPDAYYKTNVDGTKIVIHVAEQSAIKIIFSSSAAVYGEAHSKVSEDTELHPKSPYAENKRDGEELLKVFKTSAIALRYFNIYGPKQSPEYAGVITHFIINALQGKDLIIYGDGLQVRDFVYIDDVVEANMLAMQYVNTGFEIFNIGSGVETTILDLAQTIIALTESTSQIIHVKPQDGDIVYSGADITKAKKILGFEAKTPLLEGLKHTIEWYKESMR